VDHRRYRSNAERKSEHREINTIPQFKKIESESRGADRMSKLDEMKKNYQNIEIPEELKERVEKGISEGKQASKHRILPFAKGIGIVAAACAALVVTVNVNPTVAQAMEGVPVLGSIVKVVDFTTYSDKQENKQMEANVKVPEVEVVGKDGKVLTKESKELNAEVSGYLNDIIKQYQRDVAAVADGSQGHEAVTSDYRIVTDNDKLFSLRVDTEIAMGGSNSFTKIYNIDKETGKLITLKNLFADGSNYKTRISDNIKKQMREQMKKNDNLNYFLDDGEKEWDFEKIADDANFYINDKGELTFVFDKYEVAPGYMGIVEFSVPTDALSDIVKDGYLQ
jgi:hypothetical protein